MYRLINADCLDYLKAKQMSAQWTDVCRCATKKRVRSSTIKSV